MIFPLYKYATAETTKINITNRSLRFSSPTAFNDTFDSKISSVIGMSESDVRKLFLTKDEEWDYEEEYRFFIPRHKSVDRSNEEFLRKN